MRTAIIAAVLLMGAERAAAGPVLELQPATLEVDTAPGYPLDAPYLVRNAGDATLSVTQMATSGPGADVFAFSDELCPWQPSCDTDFTLAPGAERTIGFYCQPPGGGDYSATLTVSSNGGTATLPLICRSTPWQLAASPSTLDFPSIVPSDPVSLAFRITNTTPAPSPAAELALGNYDSYAFTIDAPYPYIEAGGFQDVTVTFHPAYSGTYDFPLQIMNMWTGEVALVVQIHAASGNPHFTVVEPDIDLGSAPVGQDTAVGQIVGVNDGLVPLRIYEIHGSSTDGSALAIIDGGTDLTIRLEPGETRSWDVACRPLVAGPGAGQVLFVTDASDEYTWVTVHCTGLGAALATTPADLNFGDVVLGTSATQELHITNTGTLPTELAAMTSSNPAFTLALRSGTLPVTLAAGAETIVDVTFTPADGNYASTYLTFEPSEGTGASLYARGDGLLVGAALSPTTYDYGTVAFPDQPPADFTLANEGEGPLGVLGIAVPADFQIAGIAAGDSVPAGGATAFVVRATPQRLGRIAGTATFQLANLADEVLSLAMLATDPQLAVETRDATPGDYRLDIGPVKIGTSRAGQLKIRNLRDTAIAITGCTLTGDPAFTLAGNCVAAIAPGDAAALLVKFKPTAFGARTARLRITGTGFATGALEIELAGAAMVVQDRARMAPATADTGGCSTGGGSSGLLLVLLVLLSSRCRNP
jgi:ASPM-SPD-2-Hydin domain-containing protein